MKKADHSTVAFVRPHRQLWATSARRRFRGRGWSESRCASQRERREGAAKASVECYASAMIRTIHLGDLLFLLALIAPSGFCQVNVTVKLNQPNYLVGEPIIVIVDFTNIGTEALGYSICDGHADLTVAGGQQKQIPRLRGCDLGEGSGGAVCGLDHPPTMAPGQTVSFR